MILRIMDILSLIIKRRIIVNRFDPWNEHFFSNLVRDKVTENARIAYMRRDMSDSDDNNERSEDYCVHVQWPVVYTYRG